VVQTRKNNFNRDELLKIPENTRIFVQISPTTSEPKRTVDCKRNHRNTSSTGEVIGNFVIWDRVSERTRRKFRQYGALAPSPTMETLDSQIAKIKSTNRKEKTTCKGKKNDPPKVNGYFSTVF
jgi:hypothetical protein